MIKSAPVFFSFLVLVCAFSAQADDYAKPTWPSMAQTLIRFSAIDLSDDRTLDDYAAITECKLFNALYGDDFKWNKVRLAIRDDIRKNVATYPTTYFYETELQLDHYDFHNKIYRLTEKTAIHSVNTFILYQTDGVTCNGTKVRTVPSLYRAVLDQPVTFDGLPFEEKDAEAVLKQMKEDHNLDKVINVRFNLRIVYVDQSQKKNIKANGFAAEDNRSTRLDVHLDTVDFFEDKAMTHLLYRYQP